MKKWLFIGTLFLGVLLFDFGKESKGEVLPSVESESLVEGKDARNVQQCLEILSNELKSRTCVLPRRTVQSANNTVHLRTARGQEKTFHQVRLKGEKQLHRVCEAVANRQIVNYFALLCRKGYYVYALRKLLI
jgi:hypothetical protein